MPYSMVLEFFARLVMLDYSWFVHLFLSNLFLVFMYAVIGYFVFQGKNLIASFLVVTFLVWTSTDLAFSFGWVILGATFLGIHYLTRLVVLGIAEADEALKPHFALITSLQFIAVLVIYNLFLR